MKTLTLLTFLLLLSLLSNAQSYEIRGSAHGADTINLIDVHSNKQGKWIYLGVHRPGTCTNLQQVIEEGNYKDNKKIGVWTQFHCNGKLRSTFTFVDGRPDGPASFYNSDGSLLAEGIFKYNKWSGPYKIICRNGKVLEFTSN